MDIHKPTPVSEPDSIYLENTEKIGNDLSNIILIENLLPEQEYKEMLEFCYSNNDRAILDSDEETRKYIPDWGRMSLGELPESITSYLRAIFEYGLGEASGFFGAEFEMSRNIEESAHINRWSPGDYMPAHVDDWGQHEYHVAMIYYVNDDYDGGQLSFIDRGLTIRPPANSLMIFPGNENFAHEVLAVKSGFRYNSSMWLKYSGSTYAGKVVPE